MAEDDAGVADGSALMARKHKKHLSGAAKKKHHVDHKHVVSEHKKVSHHRTEKAQVVKKVTADALEDSSDKDSQATKKEEEEDPFKTFEEELSDHKTKAAVTHEAQPPVSHAVHAKKHHAKEAKKKAKKVHHSHHS